MKKEIIEKIQAGDQKAFSELVEQHQQYAFSLAFRILCDEEEAKDVVQDSFIKVWKNMGTYNINVKFTTWLYRIITNTAIDRMRSMKRRNQVRIDEVTGLLSKMNDGDIVVELDNRETGRLIRLIADQLPEKQRMVFLLRDIQGLETEEIVEVLKQPAESIKSNLHHARKSVREKLKSLTAFERRTQ